METEALLIVLSAIPFIGLFFKRLHTKWHLKLKNVYDGWLKHHNCCQNDCNEEHKCQTEKSSNDEPETIWQLKGFSSEEEYEEFISKHPND